MQVKRRTLKKRHAAAAAVAVLSGVLGFRKADELAAEPLREKDCGPENTNPAATSAITISGQTREPAWAQRGGTINDASCLNRTAVLGIVKVRDEAAIGEALAFARERGLKVSLAGVRHSMGGQAFAPGAMVLDMTSFNAVRVDAAEKTMTVQSGATWAQIQAILHPRFAVKGMQSTNIFSVGGSISVNAHGMDHQTGAIGRTIRSMRLMQADGGIKTLSRSENADLFKLVIGGYGLFGVILDVTLDISDNVIYKTGRQIIDYKQFPSLFEDVLAKDKGLGLFYGHLSTSPDRTLLRETILYTYQAQDIPGATIPPLGEVSATALRRLTINFSKLGNIPMWIKWQAEKYIEPRMEACTVSRNQAMKDGEECLLSRNEPMNDSVAYLRNNLPGETDILQEYFVPRANLTEFIDGLREVRVRHDVNLVNASIRVVHAEDNFLSYAPADAFSVVLYINQSTDAAGSAKMKTVTGELIDLTTRLKGRFFLPYQLHYTPQQLRQSYPEIDAFFAAKRAQDPQGLFSSTWYEKYK